MDPEDLRERVSKVRWFHTIDLGQGIVTPGIDKTPLKLAQIDMPADLSGKTVLDIGAWDGFFSFEAERRGARRVLATDSFCWSGKTWGSRQGFDLSREALQSRVEDRLIDVMDLSPETVGTFDVVLFLGVLYHLRHPLLALERVSSVTGLHLILETEVDMVAWRQPVMTFYPGAQLNNDPTNWWAPNVPALCAMLKDVGFSRIAVRSPPRPLAYRLARSFKQCLAGRGNPFREYRRDRVVIHAWK